MQPLGVRGLVLVDSPLPGPSPMVFGLVVEDGRHHSSDEDGEMEKYRDPVTGQEPHHGKTDELHQEAPQAGD